MIDQAKQQQQKIQPSEPDEKPEELDYVTDTHITNTHLYSGNCFAEWKNTTQYS